MEEEADDACVAFGCCDVQWGPAILRCKRRHMHPRLPLCTAPPSGLASVTTTHSVTTHSPTFVDVHTSVSKKEAHDGFVTVLGRHKERSGASLQHGSESQTTCRRSAFDGGGIVSQNAVRKTCISATLTDLALFTSTRESARRRLTTEVIPF